VDFAPLSGVVEHKKGMKPQKLKRAKDKLVKQRIQKYIARYPTYKQPV
jgi:hypothetical protein